MLLLGGTEIKVEKLVDGRSSHSVATPTTANSSSGEGGAGFEAKEQKHYVELKVSIADSSPCVLVMPCVQFSPREGVRHSFTVTTMGATIGSVSIILDTFSGIPIPCFRRPSVMCNWKTTPWATVMRRWFTPPLLEDSTSQTVTWR